MISANPEAGPRPFWAGARLSRDPPPAGRKHAKAGAKSAIIRMIADPESRPTVREMAMSETLDELLEAARSASRSAYCPYSRFRVGAAIRAGGRIFVGGNVENASYGLTVCAERTAAFAAVLAGASRFEAIAVACVDAPEGSGPDLLMPCGACRQVLFEFAEAATPVIVDRVGRMTLGDLLPLAFRLR